MSRHFWQACNREAGFSFVELLVTIIIAGIAFAAMFPLFVGAQQSQASDGFRTIGTNLAQDMIERVRQLDTIKSPPPISRDAGFASGQFGLKQNVSSSGSTCARSTPSEQSR